MYIYVITYGCTPFLDKAMIIRSVLQPTDLSLQGGEAGCRLQKRRRHHDASRSHAMLQACTGLRLKKCRILEMR